MRSSRSAVWKAWVGQDLQADSRYTWNACDEKRFVGIGIGLIATDQYRAITQYIYGGVVFGGNAARIQHNPFHSVRLLSPSPFCCTFPQLLFSPLNYG